MPRKLCLPVGVGDIGLRLLNDWQRDFPLESRPFARIAAAVGMDEGDVIDAYGELRTKGVVSRIGAVFAPRRLGASALAAMAVPPSRLEAVAARVSAEAAINHNYQREHRYNLWFVVTASSAERLQQVVAGLERDTGCAVIVLPLEEEFHIDLGFDLREPAGEGACNSPAGRRRERASIVLDGDTACALPAIERELVTALQGGLALEARPFESLGKKVGLSEAMTLEFIARWVCEGLIRRFGVVVRHHELGMEANAMCVWDVPEQDVSALGRSLAREHAVTLCYRRRRALPDWPYNLFCMIHGSAREDVLAARADLAQRLGLDAYPSATLFSCRRFKQTGAHYLSPGALAHA